MIKDRAMRMTMDDEFRTRARENVFESGAIKKSTPPRSSRLSRWMVQNNDACAVFFGERRKHCFEPLELGRADPAGCGEGRQRNGRRNTNKSRRSSSSHKRKARLARRRHTTSVSGEVRFPKTRSPLPGDIDIKIVIAGDDGDVLRRSQAPDPSARALEFGR